VLVLIAGLPGSGKSTLAQAIARQTEGAVIDKDRLRAALFAPPDIEYSAGQDDFCMELMLETAQYLLTRRPTRLVLLDGRTFSRAYQRRRVIEYAQAIGQDWRVLECVCAEATARKRIALDMALGSHPAGNRTEDLYASVRESWEPVPEPKIVIDTEQPLEACVARALKYLVGDLPPSPCGMRKLP